MTVSNSPLAYDDCYATMQAALNDDSGLKLRMSGQDAAIHFRMRCHTARRVDRDQNTLTYEKGDPLHGTSQYDKLVFRIKLEDSLWWLYVEKNNTIPGIAVSLTDGKDVEMDMPQRVVQRTIEHRPQLQLAAPTDKEIGEAFEDVPTVPAPKVRRI